MIMKNSKRTQVKFKVIYEPLRRVCRKCEEYFVPNGKYQKLCVLCKDIARTVRVKKKKNGK